MRQNFKRNFYRFFKLTPKHRLVTHLRPDDAEIQEYYSNSFIIDSIEVNVILHLYDEDMIYDFFAEKANKVFMHGNEVEEDQLYIDRWADHGIESFLCDAIESLRGFCILFYPKDPSVLKNGGQLMYEPLLNYFVECVLYNSEIQPPQWIKEEDIETAINIITHMHMDVKNINPPNKKK